MGYEDCYKTPEDGFFSDVEIEDEHGIVTPIPGELMRRAHVDAHELSAGVDSPHLQDEMYSIGLQIRFDEIYHSRHGAAIIAAQQRAQSQK